MAATAVIGGSFVEAGMATLTLALWGVALVFWLLLLMQRPQVGRARERDHEKRVAPARASSAARTDNDSVATTTSSDEASRWSFVFPLGTFSAASHALAEADTRPALNGVGRTFFVIALAAWSLVLLGLGRHSLGARDRRVLNSRRCSRG